MLKRDPSSDKGAGLAEQVWDIRGIRCRWWPARVLQGLEVIVQCVPHHHLALQQLKDLLLGHLKGDSLVHVLAGDATPAGAIVHNGHFRPDVFVIENVTTVAHHRAAG